jgi:ATP-binding cassette subfamily B (MDR/TAP) protein 1
MLSGKILSKAHCPATVKDRETMSKVPYASAIGSIMYAMLCTRPDVSNALSLIQEWNTGQP